MALLVTDQGEIDSLRTLLNATHQIPRNLVLKLYTSNTTPAEADVPSANDYYEPYDATNTSGYGSAATTGYPTCDNNRTEEDQDFGDQYGILLNGNRWNIATTLVAVTTKANVSGTTGTYQISVPDADDIKKGDYAEGAGIPTNTYVVDIQGTDIELSQQLTATLDGSATASVDFGRGRTTASYPEQVFTFSGPAGSVYGYYLARANNMPEAIQGVADAGSVSAGTQITKTGCKGVIGADYINLANITVTPAITAGVSGTFEITVDSVTGLAAGQRVEGQGIPAQTRVVGISGTQVYLDKALTAASGGNATFHVEVAKELTAGMVVSQTATPNGIAASTTIVGIDYTTYTGEIGPRVYLSNQLIDNIQVTNGNDAVLFDFAVITTDPGGTATPHGLNPGDVIYIAQGTGGAHVAAHYTVFETPSDTTITTTPALGGNVGKATLYSSIFFAERFTNGPYAIQNSGDQIKVTLNVSLD